MMLNSKRIILIVATLLVAFRGFYSNINGGEIKVTTYDALGYYIYLPAILKYNDSSALEWYDAVDEKYSVSGSAFYQAQQAENGKYVFKYYGGVALMQLPFYLAADLYAKCSAYPDDGFSMPYQLAVVIAALFYSILGLILLRWLMLQYFDDWIVSLTIIMLILATNAPQYISIDAGQSHVYIFLLYCLLLFLTQRWHQDPHANLALAIGAVCGLATACRPTELICIFIPLLWGLKGHDTLKSKCSFLLEHKKHIWFAVFGGFIMLLPQIVYWKISTGQFVYDVGSKWVFLNPFFRVLFGWEKGWFIYTPITIFFIGSLFFIAKKQFRKSIWIFTFLNLWIITAWYDWRYGGSYSTRALVQSYPVFALAIGTALSKIYHGKWRHVIHILLSYLIIVNCLQLYQYNEGILHYDDMNKKYYHAIYLDPEPTSLTYSLLDTDDYIRRPKKLDSQIFYQSTKLSNSEGQILNGISLPKDGKVKYLKTNLNLTIKSGFWQSHLIARIMSKDKIIKEQRFRLNIPNAQVDRDNDYSFYTEVPDECFDCKLELAVEGTATVSLQMNQLSITQFTQP